VYANRRCQHTSPQLEGQSAWSGPSIDGRCSTKRSSGRTGGSSGDLCSVRQFVSAIAVAADPAPTICGGGGANLALDEEWCLLGCYAVNTSNLT
jgi:hypothetical protein